MKKILNSLLTVRLIIWLFVLAFTGLFVWLGYMEYISYWWTVIPGALLLWTFYDTFVQRKHSILINFPVLARLRYFFESFRPEIRQYFFESELDGKPFNRRQRSIVYQRAKDVKQTISFGMQDNPDRIGYEWAAHSIYTTEPDVSKFRVTVGGEKCTQPYDLSVLNISAMSFGSLSKTAVMALNLGAMEGGFAHNTGEGAISDYHLSGGDIIWQVGTGYFGCRDDKGHFSREQFKEKSRIPNVKMIELKISQGAKPGHGGILPKEKNTPEIARVRHVEPWTTIASPCSHSAFSDAKGLIKFIAELRELSGGKPIGFKICIGRKKEFIDIVNAMVEADTYPDFITIDGAEGGTGASPIEFIDSLGMSLYDALSFVTQVLTKAGIKDKIRIIASGKVITAFDIAKCLSLGANACYSARGMMFALGCIQALKCDSGDCPVGIATQDKRLYKALDVKDKSKRVATFHKNTMIGLQELMGACGFNELSDVQPNFFYKRTEFNQNISFKDLYFDHSFHNGTLDALKSAVEKESQI